MLKNIKGEKIKMNAIEEFIIYVLPRTEFVLSLLPEKREKQEIINPEFSVIKYKQKRHSPEKATVAPETALPSADIK